MNTISKIAAAISLMILTGVCHAQAKIRFDYGPQELDIWILGTTKNKTVRTHYMEFSALDNKGRARIWISTSEYGTLYKVISLTGHVIGFENGLYNGLEDFMVNASPACPIHVKLDPTDYKITDVIQNCPLR